MKRIYKLLNRAVTSATPSPHPHKCVVLVFRLFILRQGCPNFF